MKLILKLSRFIAAWIVMQHATPLLGNNNYFLPGDAFFSTAVSSSTFEAAGDNENGELRLTYVRGSVDVSQFSGFAGYTTLVIFGDTANLRSALERRVMLDRGDADKLDAGQAEDEGHRRLRLLIYNRSFDFDKFKLGVTYNERWMDEVKLFGHIGKVRLCPFVSVREGVVESWRNASSVDPLRAKVPDTPVSRGRAVDVPLRIDADDVAVVVLGVEADVAERKEKIGLMNRAFRKGIRAGRTDGTVLLELADEKGDAGGK